MSNARYTPEVKEESVLSTSLNLRYFGLQFSVRVNMLCAE